jgi:peptidoglycan/xylan/chitin deacetylase (PgdA/CDA1 family)
VNLFKEEARNMIGGAALLPLVERRTRHSLAGRTNIVYYHYVGPERPYYAEFDCGCSLERLNHDLDVLARYFDFAPLSEVIASNGLEVRKRPLLAVTFDDGFDMLGNGVADLLDRHSVSATTFLITSCVGNSDLMWRNKLSAIRSLCPENVCLSAYNALMDQTGLPGITSSALLMHASASWPMALKEELANELWMACEMQPLTDFLAEHRPYFTWEGLDEWRARGHTIGLHTHTHPRCSELDRTLVETEIVLPSRRLKERFALGALPFSYPFGARLPRAREAELFADGIFSCALGIDGFARRGTPADRLERACAEDGFAFEVFGRALLGMPR